MHLARVLRALHLIGPKLNDAPIEKRSYGRELGVFERAIWYIYWLDALLCPCDRWRIVSKAIRDVGNID